MKLVLDTKGLAEALSLSANTVKQYASHSPEKLPPRLKLPYRKLAWAVEDVQAWLAKQQRASEPAQQP